MNNAKFWKEDVEVMDRLNAFYLLPWALFRILIQKSAQGELESLRPCGQQILIPYTTPSFKWFYYSASILLDYLTRLH